MKICKGTVSRRRLCIWNSRRIGDCELGLRNIFTKNQIMINDLFKEKIVCCFKTKILFYSENFLKILEHDKYKQCVNIKTCTHCKCYCVGEGGV
jgi:hypothetical protein